MKEDTNRGEAEKRKVKEYKKRYQVHFHLSPSLPHEHPNRGEGEKGGIKGNP